MHRGYAGTTRSGVVQTDNARVYALTIYRKPLTHQGTRDLAYGAD